MSPCLLHRDLKGERQLKHSENNVMIQANNVMVGVKAAVDWASNDLLEPANVSEASCLCLSERAVFGTCAKTEDSTRRMKKQLK